MNNQRHMEKLFEIDIFSWGGWDQADDFVLNFYEVEFPFESMKKFNGKTVSLYHSHDESGMLEVWSEDGKEIEWSGYLIEIPEFRERLFNTYLANQNE